MENEDEIKRLEMKTDLKSVARCALWAGIAPGMRVADIGCGPGKTTAMLADMVKPGGKAVGVDFAEKRIEHARQHYTGAGIEFINRDAREPLGDLGMFDLVWVRFLLEYYKEGAAEIVRNLSSLVCPGGTLFLIDLDGNCMNHYELSQRLEKTLIEVIKVIQNEHNFDPFMGRRLYSFIYDLGYEDIAVDVSAHHLIFGELKDVDEYNWMKKIKVISGRIGYDFPEYEDGCEGFITEFDAFFSNPRRFTYTPIICCKGKKPL